MGSTVRSKLLGSGAFSDGDAHTLYTCPPGTTTIVKFGTITVWAPGTAVVTLYSQSSGVAVVLLPSPNGLETVGITTEALWPTWHVLEPGDTVWCQGDGTGNYSCSASGAELAGVAT